MKFETLINMILCAFIFALGLLALVVAVFCSAWWHFITATICGVFFQLLYTENGEDSVRNFINGLTAR